MDEVSRSNTYLARIEYTVKSIVVPITMKTCESFQLIQLCEKRSRSNSLGLILKSKASIFIVVGSFKIVKIQTCVETLNNFLRLNLYCARED